MNILAADKLMGAPQALRNLPAVDAFGAIREVARGRRPGKPKLVFFFDEAHLLFNDLPSTLQAKSSRSSG